MFLINLIIYFLQKRKLSISDDNDETNITILNLELVNKNDKKLIKLNSGRLDHNLAANYDSLKIKINQIISEETTNTTTSSNSSQKFTFVSLQDSLLDDDNDELAMSSSETSSCNELNRSGSEAGDEDHQLQTNDFNG